MVISYLFEIKELAKPYKLSKLNKPNKLTIELTNKQQSNRLKLQTIQQIFNSLL